MIRRLLFRVRTFLRHSVWILPVATLVFALVFVRLVRWADAQLGWEAAVHAEGARALLGALASSMLTFIVFVFSILLVTLQIAGAQLSPRLIEIALRDRVTSIALSAFVFTFTFSLAVLARIDDTVPQLAAWIATYGNLACIAVYIWMIEHVGRMLRPASLLDRVAREGRQAVEAIYPRLTFDPPAAAPPAPDPVLDAASAHVVLQRGGGVLVAYDRDGLVELARQADCVIELVPQVGEFVADGRPLLRVYGAGAGDVRGLRWCVALARERRIDHDPAFALRIMVETASKALSPAINDPATAVLALDRLHELLRLLGARRLDVGRVRDASGRLRLVVRVPRWEDVVASSAVEIRQFGAGSVQVPRRMRAMLEDLIASLPSDRTTPLRRELALLRRSTERAFPDAEDRDLADVADTLGMGGAPS
jgi:uncharacterized membrane protein